jgi:hypothetical protein
MMMFDVTNCGVVITEWDIGLLLQVATPQEQLGINAEQCTPV